MSVTSPHASPFAATAPGERQAIYAQLAKDGSVHQILLPGDQPAWLVTGYDEVRQVLADPRFIKSGSPMGDAIQALPEDVELAISSDMLHLDPPDHTRLRRLVSAAFTRRRVEALTPRITALADELLGAMAASVQTQDHVDLIDAYAFPLPMTVICELLGVPSDDAAEFRGWSATIVTGALIGPERWTAAAIDLVGYIRSLLETKRRTPADDLLSALVATHDGEDRLSEDELTSMVFLLLIAGHETTVNLIGNGVHTLLAHPDQLALLRADPARLPAFLEEILRFEGPVQVATPRFTAEALVLGGVMIPAGQTVVPALMPANRDDGHFERPRVFDPARAQNPHMAFGHGIHHCLGAPLARLEGRIALDRLLTRFPAVRLAVRSEDLAWRPSFLMHGLSTLPVTLR